MIALAARVEGALIVACMHLVGADNALKLQPRFTVEARRGQGAFLKRGRRCFGQGSVDAERIGYPLPGWRLLGKGVWLRGRSPAIPAKARAVDGHVWCLFCGLLSSGGRAVAGHVRSLIAFGMISKLAGRRPGDSPSMSSSISAFSSTGRASRLRVRVAITFGL